MWKYDIHVKISQSYIIEPYSLRKNIRAAFNICAQEQTKEIRSFRTDRIMEVKVTSEPFIPPINRVSTARPLNIKPSSGRVKRIDHYEVKTCKILMSCTLKAQ